MIESSTFLSATALGAGAIVIAVSRILRRRLDAGHSVTFSDGADALFALCGATLLIGTFAAPDLLPEATGVFRWTILAYLVASVLGEVREARREHSREA